MARRRASMREGPLAELFRATEAAQRQAEELAQKAQDVSGVQVVAAPVNVPDEKVLREMGDMVRARLSRPGVVVVASSYDERVGIQVSVDPVLVQAQHTAGVAPHNGHVLEPDVTSQGAQRPQEDVHVVSWHRGQNGLGGRLGSA